MIVNGPVTKDVIGKYAVYYNGCFAEREDLEIVGINDCGTRVDMLRDGAPFTEPITHIPAIVDNVGDTYD